MSRLVYIFPGIPGVGTARGPDMNQSRSRERLYQRHLVSGLFILPQVGQHLQEQKKRKRKNASSQAVTAAAVQQPQATSIIIIMEGGKHTETAFISFNPLVCIGVFCCWQANDPPHFSHNGGR